MMIGDGCIVCGKTPMYGEYFCVEHWRTHVHATVAKQRTAISNSDTQELPALNSAGRWQVCPICSGAGQEINPNTGTVTFPCGACGGSGSVTK